MRKFINYLKESYTEMTKKVSWPTWSKLQSSAIVVMVASVIFAVVVFVMDFAFQNLMTAIYTLKMVCAESSRRKGKESQRVSRKRD